MVPKYFFPAFVNSLRAFGWFDTPIKQETTHHPPTMQPLMDKNNCGKVLRSSLIQ